MRLSDFGRLIGAPKQTVADWKRTGKITVGADGLLDPREAVRQLLRNTDPARLRVRVLAPILAEVRAAQANAAGLLSTIAELRAQLAEAWDEADFHEQAADELLTLRGMLKRRVLAELDELAELPPVERAARLDALDAAAFDELEGRECLSSREVPEGSAGLEVPSWPTAEQRTDGEQ